MKKFQYAIINEDGTKDLVSTSPIKDDELYNNIRFMLMMDTPMSITQWQAHEFITKVLKSRAGTVKYHRTKHPKLTVKVITTY